MSFTKPKSIELIHKQIRFKLNANVASFSILVFLQLLALLLSFPNGENLHFYNEVTLIEVSNDIHVGFTIMWALLSGIGLGSYAKWNESFTFVSTRFTHHMSNLVYMVIASFFAGIVISLSGPALRLLTYLRYEDVAQSTLTITEAPVDFLLQFITGFLYLLLFFLIGYTIQAIYQSSRLFGGIYLIILFALFFTFNVILGFQIVDTIVFSFLGESSFPLFLLKVCAAVAILFSFAVLITNRLEVRR